ncbi:MAG TPA: lipocalin family protein, partial [Saprospiraceae bacterium]|nr:lipocalin family protein [Saprospiraceae bacterium]
AQLAACDKDNFVEFKADGSFVSDEGATKCNAADPQQETGTWAFAQNETHLVVAGADYDFDAEIVELTDSKIEVKYDTDLSGIVTTTTTVFVKK